MVSCERSKAVSFFSLMMKNICISPSGSRFPVKLICCIGFGSASKFCFFFLHLLPLTDSIFRNEII